jgi:hypothetical protein
MSTDSGSCPEAALEFARVTIAEGVFLTIAFLVYAVFAIACYWTHHNHAKEGKLSAYDAIGWSAFRQLICISAFSTVFLLLHARNTWRFRVDGCALGSVWDNASIDACAQLLGVIALWMFVWPAMTAIFSYRYDPGTTGYYGQFAFAGLLLVSALATFALVLFAWIYPENSILQSPALTHTVSVIFSCLLVVPMCFGEARRWRTFRKADAKVAEVDTSVQNAHLLAKAQAANPSDDPPKAVVQRVVKTSNTGACFDCSAALIVVMRLAALLFLCVAFQMLLEDEYHPSEDKFNATSSYQLAYNFVVATFILLAIGINLMASTAQFLVVGDTAGKEFVLDNAKDVATYNESPMLLM